MVVPKNCWAKLDFAVYTALGIQCIKLLIKVSDRITDTMSIMCSLYSIKLPVQALQHRAFWWYTFIYVYLNLAVFLIMCVYIMFKYRVFHNTNIFQLAITFVFSVDTFTFHRDKSFCKCNKSMFHYLKQ